MHVTIFSNTSHRFKYSAPGKITLYNANGSTVHKQNVNSKEQLLDFLDRSIKITSTNFMKPHTVAEKYFHADKQKKERTDRHNDAKIPFS